MEEYEIKGRRMERQASSGGDVGPSRTPFILAIVGIILVTSVVLVLMQASMSHDTAGEGSLGLVSRAEKLQGKCETPFCNTADCVKMASRVLRHVDKKADPCVDFYEYACGGNENPLPDSRITFDSSNEAQSRFVLDINAIMESTPAENATGTLGKMKEFYDPCINLTQRSLDEPDDLRRWFIELGVLGGEADEVTSEEAHTTWTELVSKLEGYQTHTLLAPLFRRVGGSAVDTLEVDCNVPFLAPYTYLVNNTKNAYLLSLYKEAVYATLHAMGVDYDKGRGFVEDVLKIETDLAWAMRSSGSREDHHLSDENVNLLKEIWRPFIGDGVQELEVRSTCKFNMNDILSILNNSPPRRSVRYVTWRLLVETLPHLGENMTRVNNMLMSQFPGWRYQYPHTWAQCSEVIRSDLGLAATRALKSSGYIRKDIAEKAHETFEKLRHEFLNSLKRIDLHIVDNSTKRTIFEKIHGLKLNVAYPDVADQPGILEDLYNNKLVAHLSPQLEFGGNHFQNVLNLKKFLRYHFFERLWYEDDGNPASKIPLDRSPLGASSSYDSFANTVHVDLGFLSRPMVLYSEEVPKYLKFGDVILLAKEMSLALGAAGPALSNHFRDCLMNQVRESPQKVNKNLLNDVFADIVGLTVTYEGLSDYLKEYKSEKLLPSLHLTKKQTYFLQAAQKYCELRDENSIIYDPKKSLPHRRRLNLAVANMEHFSSIFNCPSGSELNRTPKCVLH